MVLLGGEAHVESYFVHLGTVLVLTQDRCTVRAKCTVELEINLDAPDGAPR
jgi:hypothetical protein